MKFLIQFVAILFSAHLLALFMPWYSIALAAFVMGFILKSNTNFLAGFSAIATLWIFNAWLIDSASSSDLAERVAKLLMLKYEIILFIVMAFIGGLVGGLAAVTGSLLRK
ncbi:MAG TPA: hypothetical protein VK589_25810 [Chryseolinea sp.]|nr:hypothetical protein [Chryseolinea sp.]